MKHNQKDVIIACDFSNAQETLDFLSLFHEEKLFVKIGMELFYAEGPSIVRSIKKRGHKIFLDLKLHDIPNTVRNALSILSSLNVDMCSVHAAGTIEMMKAARIGFTSDNGAKPLLIAVTQLTSTDENQLEKELLIKHSMADTVKHYAKNALLAGLDGVVCSPLEAESVHSVCGDNFITVTPGIRFANNEKADQKRIATPERARELGSDFIVVGRPITLASVPLAAYLRCRKEFLGL